MKPTWIKRTITYKDMPDYPFIAYVHYTALSAEYQNIIEWNAAEKITITMKNESVSFEPMPPDFDPQNKSVVDTAYVY